MTMDSKEAKAIRNEIVELKLKTLYKPNIEVETQIETLLEKLYPIATKVVSRYGEEQKCYVTTCNESFPIQYWSKRKVIEEHSVKCKVCNVLLGYSKQKKGFSQKEVAKLFEHGIEVTSSSGNFIANDSILWHYNTIEAIRTLEGKIISNLDCFARGFAHCTQPKSDAYINLTTFRRFIGHEWSNTEILREIRIVEAKGNTTLFTWRKRYYLNATDEQRFIVELVKPCSTIKEAYESMKPNKVKIAERLNNHVLRQGDFFFIPTTLEDKDFKHIEKTIVHRDIERDYYEEKDYLVTRMLRPEIELDSRHTATRLARIGSKTYVKGYIRHPQHSALKLEKWHLVAKNVVKNSISVTTLGAD